MALIQKYFGQDRRLVAYLTSYCNDTIYYWFFFISVGIVSQFHSSYMMLHYRLRRNNLILMRGLFFNNSDYCAISRCIFSTMFSCLILPGLLCHKQINREWLFGGYELLKFLEFCLKGGTIPPIILLCFLCYGTVGFMLPLWPLHTVNPFSIVTQQ